MLGNYLTAALRNLARNRLHAAITTASLAIGFATVLLSGSQALAVLATFLHAWRVTSARPVTALRYE